MATFTARFKALQPNIVKAIATKDSAGDEVKTRAVEPGALREQERFCKGKSIAGRGRGPPQEGRRRAGPAARQRPRGLTGLFKKRGVAASSNLLER